MCGISWQIHPQGYDLFFNRDEQRDRPTAESPKLFHDPAGIAYLAPTDPQGGGTWLFVNTHGLTGALLNAYVLDGAAPPPEAPQSRGQLLRALATADTVAAFGAALGGQLERAPYQPCYLFALSPAGAPGLWLWNGRTLEAPDIPDLPFFTTSSHRPAEVHARRRERFLREVGQSSVSPDALERFHRDEDGRQSAFDVRMSRDDARSVNLTHVRSRPEAQTMAYAPRDGDGSFAPFARVALAGTEHTTKKSFAP